MKKLFVLLAVVILFGCKNTRPSVQPPQPVVETTKYVVKIPPASMMKLPTPVAPINPDTADEVAVSNWMISKEKYTRTLESMLVQIAKFLQDQQTQLDSQQK